MNVFAGRDTRSGNRQMILYTHSAAILGAKKPNRKFQSLDKVENKHTKISTNINGNLTSW